MLLWWCGLQDPRIERIPCTHKGTYADDCLCERVRQHKCYIVATCDKDLRRRIRKVRWLPVARLSCTCKVCAVCQAACVTCGIISLGVHSLGWLVLVVLACVVELCGDDYTTLARGWLAYVPPTVIANGEQSMSHSDVMACWSSSLLQSAFTELCCAMLWCAGGVCQQLWALRCQSQAVPLLRFAEKERKPCRGLSPFMQSDEEEQLSFGNEPDGDMSCTRCRGCHPCCCLLLIVPADPWCAHHVHLAAQVQH